MNFAVNKKKCFSVFVLSILHSSAITADETGKIVGGSFVQEYKYKFLVSIRYGYYKLHKCGGTIIGSEVILTAAHCIYQENPVSVYYGSNYLNRDNIRNTIKSTFYHENYSPVTHSNDIGLLFLKTQIRFDDQVQPVRLGAIQKFHQGVKMIGWGLEDPKNSHSLSSDLKMVKMVALPANNCRLQMPRSKKTLVKSTNICTRGRVGSGDCQGDSGGPLLDKTDRQVGIVSWGIGCAKKFPNVYTKVASYIQWINGKTGLHLIIS